MTYLILQNPGHNRVYYNLAHKLALAELKLASLRFSVKTQSVSVIELKGVRYLKIEVQEELNADDIGVISQLSFVFALYKLSSLNNTECLIPIEKLNIEFVDSKISSLLKYQGKTNELFTKMMINVALLASDYSYSDSIELLDPVAGKGTTLFEGLVYGFNATGVELETKSVHETGIFFKKFLEEERLKHSALKRQLAGSSKAESVNIQEFDFAKSKQDFKSNEKKKRLAIVNGNAQSTFKYFKGQKFHLIVGDLPYGIVHGNTGDKKNASITRNPSELMEKCAEGWFKVLKKGGVLVLAWNVFVASKQKMAAILSEQGFEVMQEAPYNEFEHMVDKSIKRDIIIAKKA